MLALQDYGTKTYYHYKVSANIANITTPRTRSKLSSSTKKTSSYKEQNYHALGI
jgi:hypothetical protein